MQGLLRKYGLTLLEYRAMLDRQGGRCAICGADACVTGKRFAVDHCHRTNQVRGLLCHCCNTGIGQLQDNPVILRAAIRYLEESQNV